MPKSPKARKENSKREREEGRMSEEGLNPFRKSSRTERSPSRGEERNQSKEIEKKIETVLREIKEDMAGTVEESKVRRKELVAAREKEGDQEREDMLKSSEVRKESSKIEREEGRTSKEGNENNHDKRDEREDQNTKKGISGSERGEWGAKERISDSERGDERKRRKMAVGEGRLYEKDENDRGKDGTKRKEGEEE
ncbi:hypothetical protein MTP99_001036 [Tenebrio molitor]|nr:hypothetical protein MTP99_001036 [Tenebrio molitor]